MTALTRDGGEADPYTLALREFLELLTDRFPSTPELLKKKDFLAALKTPPYGNLHGVRGLADEAASELFAMALDFEVPRRDLELLRERLVTIKANSKRLSALVRQCQLAVETAYLDGIGEDRFHFALLAEKRDALFLVEPMDLDRAVEDFLSALAALILERQSRGYPGWLSLDEHATTIKAELLKKKDFLAAMTRRAAAAGKLSVR